MKLTGLHLLLTYQCTMECNHCFTWGSPWQCGTMTLQDLREIVRQAEASQTVKSIYFEGGEPFLYYPIMLAGVRMASEMGLTTGIVSNSYWATTEEDALEWLRPFAGLVASLSVSSDLYHYSEKLSRQAENAIKAAEKLGIPLGVISIAQLDDLQAPQASGQLPTGESAIMFRGRAVRQLAPQAENYAWQDFTECPYEDLRDPARVHLGPLGHVHICQGISLGNVFEIPLSEICARYDPTTHPITGLLIEGGPAELARRHGLEPEEGYADACHLCYATRVALRERYPAILTPDQMYGALEGL